MRRTIASLVLASVACATPTYQNPVLNMDFPDPTVIRGGDGLFYVYGTMGNGNHLQVASSPDLVTWSYHGEALKVPAWAGKDTWAPDVTLHNGTYWMYFAASNAATGLMCLAVATSPHPLGPFVDARGSPLLCSSTASPFADIDPKSWDEPSTGKIYLFLGSDFLPLRVLELSPSRTAIAPGSVPSPVLAPEPSAPYESLVEGSWLHPCPGGLCLYYSGSNCCGASAHYAVMVAKATSPTGPFVKLGNATGSGDSVILAESSAFVAPGHNSIITDDAGNDWMFYHAYVAGQQANGPRVLLMDRIVYSSRQAGDGSDVGVWPSVGEPSAAVMPAPIVQQQQQQQEQQQAPAAPPAINSIPAAGALVRWVGRTQAVGDTVNFDWEGVSATVTVTGASYLAVNISDNCPGSAVGGGSRWLVTMNVSSDLSAAPPNHRISTFYTGSLQQLYYMYNNPGSHCDPNCNVGGSITFKLTRLTESRLSGCTAAAGLFVNSFLSDGQFLSPPSAPGRRLEFIGDSISAGDLNDMQGTSSVTVCANAAWDDDITYSSGGQLCLASAFNADCMFTAWGGIQLGLSPNWGMSDLYPFMFSSAGTNAYAPWNFSSFPVDAVISNLGTNDRPAPPALAWQAAYVEFVSKVVHQFYANPDLVVFLAYGPMTTEYEPFVVNITATLVSAGVHAYALDLTLPHPMTGCYGHPSAADNVEIAAKAAPQIAKVLGW